jgi:polysaccharide pyruvyl transferase WcaK-like protein
MLQVTVRRFREFWPDAEICVFTEAPNLLEFYCPTTKAIDPIPRLAYYTTAAALTRLGRRHSMPMLSEFDVAWRQYLPMAVEKMLALRTGGVGVSQARSFVDLVKYCNLVVASGAGQITTSFAAHSTLILNTMEMAMHHGIPTAIFGQGLGPIDEVCLHDRAARVLPRVNQICIREVSTSEPLLDELGVPREQVIVTGDDSIETVYSNRSNQLGNAIGVNLRTSWYSHITNDLLLTLRKPLQEVAATLRAQLVQVPISRHPEEDDSGVCRYLFEGYESVAEPVHDLITVEGLIREIGRCRVVVTTSYHAGVFALAQGIPVVAWLKSQYFAAKLNGLGEQFGVGCKVVFLDGEEVSARLKDAILSSWYSAEQLRPRLLDSARAQLSASKAAYEKLRRDMTRWNSGGKF